MKTATTKEQEIKALKALVEMSGYFAEFFGKDIDQMIKNIQADYPIQMCTHFNERAENMQSYYEEADRVRKNKDFDMCCTMLQIYKDTGDDRAYDIVVKHIGRLATIELICDMGYEPSTSDIDFLLTRAKRNQLNI
jgi:hypothetical protein